MIAKRIPSILAPLTLREAIETTKGAQHFAQSLIDGRPFSQAGRMSSSPFRPTTLSRERARSGPALGLSREALQGALVTLMLIFDVPVFRSTEPAESARLIHYIGSQLVLCATQGKQAKRSRFDSALIVSSVRGSKASRSRSHHARLEHHRRLWEGAAIMTEQTAEQVREKVGTVYRSESRRILATLIRLLGDFDLAEDVLGSGRINGAAIGR